MCKCAPTTLTCLLLQTIPFRQFRALLIVPANQIYCHFFLAEECVAIGDKSSNVVMSRVELKSQTLTSGLKTCLWFQVKSYPADYSGPTIDFLVSAVCPCLIQVPVIISQGRSTSSRRRDSTAGIFSPQKSNDASMNFKSTKYLWRK